MKFNSRMINCLITAMVLIAVSAYAVDERTAKVKQVYDGDTILLSNGEEVRYIGIDAPETHHPRKPVEKFGDVAANFNKELVGGKEVRLEFGGQVKDRYKRTLAYVYVGDKFVNLEMLKAGLAIAYGNDPNNEHSDSFLNAEKEARTAKMGIWGLPLAKPEKEYIVTRKKEPRAGELNPRRVFHRPDCEHAARISPKNRVALKTYDQALDEGYRPCNTCTPLQR
jgi:micrococcal nuclease